MSCDSLETTSTTTNLNCTVAMITGRWGKPSEVLLEIAVEPDGIDALTGADFD